MVNNLEHAVIQVLNKHFNKHDHPHPHSHKLFTWDFARALFAEFLATCIFVLLLCSTASSNNHLQISLTAGLAIATLVQCFGHISGGHINPAVTLAFMITRKLAIRRGTIYILVQCSGAITGAGLLYGLTSDDTFRLTLGANLVNPDSTPWKGLGIEIILTFILVFTVFATVDPHRKELGSSSLAIGLVVLVAHLVGISYTGTGINPARSFGPAIISGQWQHHWVFWVGPIFGALCAGLLYEYVFDINRRVRDLKDALEEKHKVSDPVEGNIQTIHIQTNI